MPRLMLPKTNPPSGRKKSIEVNTVGVERSSVLVKRKGSILK